MSTEPVILTEIQSPRLYEVHPLINPQSVTGWLDWLCCQQQSKITHERNLKAFYLWIMEQNISQPGKTDLERYRDQMLKDHSANTVKNYLVSLKSFFSFLEESGIYPNISKRVKLPKLPPNHLKEPLIPDQIRQLMGMCDSSEKGLRDKAIIALMACTGLRVNAIREANIGDLRAKNGQRVLEYLQKGYDTKSGFYVEIPEPLMELIERYLIVRFKGREWRKEEPLFTTQSRNNSGQRMSQQSVSGMIKKRMREIGLDDSHYSAHSLRHSFATVSHRSGASREAIQQIMGHSDSKTTERYIKDDERADNTTVHLVTANILGK